MTGEWAIQDIFALISDKVIISVLSKDHPRIQAALCTTVKLNLEWRFHFPSSWPQPPCFLFPPVTADRPVQVYFATQSDGLTSLMFLQCDAVSKSTANQSPQDHLCPRGDRGEDPFLEDSSSPLRTSKGTSGTTKRTVSFTEATSSTVCSMRHGHTGLPHTWAVFNDQLLSCVLQIEVI